MADFNSERVTIQPVPALDLTQIESDITKLQSDVSTIQSDISTAQSDISTAQSDISTAQSDISNIQSNYAQLSGASFTGEVDVVSATTAGSTSVRQITMSTSSPSGGADGDVWLVYT